MTKITSLPYPSLDPSVRFVCSPCKGLIGNVGAFIPDCVILFLVGFEVGWDDVLGLTGSGMGSLRLGILACLPLPLELPLIVSVGISLEDDAVADGSDMVTIVVHLYYCDTHPNCICIDFVLIFPRSFPEQEGT